MIIGILNIRSQEKEIVGYIKCEAGYVEETGGISTIIVKSTLLRSHAPRAAP